LELSCHAGFPTVLGVVLQTILDVYIYITNEKVPTPNTNNIIATTIPTVKTTSAGSPEVLTPTSYITLADMAKWKEHVDADLLCSVDRRGHLGSLCWNIMHMVITVM
jgi:hypothetical protein